MDFKRINDLDRPKLEQLGDAARAEGNELVEQLTNAILHFEDAWGKQACQMEALLTACKIYMPIAQEPPEGSLAERLYNNFKEAVETLEGKSKEAELKKLVMDETGVKLDFRSTWAARLITGAMVKMLKKDDGTWWNNLTFTCRQGEEPFYVEIQRVKGKTVKQQLTEAEAEIAKLRQSLGNVLARIHRDGGHYIEENGLEKAVVDADAMVCADRTKITNLEAENLALRNGYAGQFYDPKCTRVPETCPVDECSACAVLHCPGGEPLHFHHDGCPYCSYVEHMTTKED